MAKLITDKLNFNEAEIQNYNKEIQVFISEISTCRQVREINISESANRSLLLVTLNLNITLPLKRSKMKVEIKKNEPIAILIIVNQFPYNAPVVFSNRKDFPVSKLPHVSLWWNAIPNICLHRGDLNDWFIEHTATEYINRIHSWFKDAASGRLIKSGDDFEPMTVRRTSGTLVYSYDKITNFIENYWNINNGKEGFAFFSFTLINKEEESLLGLDEEGDSSIQVVKLYDKRDIDKLIYECEINKRVPIKNYYIGIIAWCNKSEQFDQYIEYIPDTLNELITICQDMKINLNQPLNVLKNNNKRTKDGAALIVAINRPTNLIGHNKNIELINFFFGFEKKIECKVEKLIHSTKALIVKHLEPMTKELAAYISNVNLLLLEKQILTIGVGALGSKIIYHLARNGFVNNRIIDNDILNPHNLVRHALNADSIGKKKSTELKEKLEEIYYSEQEKNFQASEESFFQFARTNELDSYDILLDFSASKSVGSFLSDYTSTLPKKIFRGELAFEGKLGFLFIEGIDRMPRLDEIQIVLFKLALTNNEVSKWLRKYKEMRDDEGEAEFEDIIIGLGCNTSTMKLSDEIVSYHAALFTNYIKKDIEKFDNNNGKILISYFNDQDYSENYCSIIPINKFVNINSYNSEWQVKIYEDIYKQIRQKLKLESPKETGGILLGRIDIIKKIIYVVDTFTPDDSEGTLNTFKKGSKGTKEYLEQVSYKTGEMIIYVGDWHTHPNGSLNMSGTDVLALSEQKSEIKNKIWPAHILIFNNLDCISYII